MKYSHPSLSSKLLIILILSPSAWAAQEGAKEERLKPSQLPAAVAEAIKSNCRNCVVDKATREVENGVTVYDLEFKYGQGEMDVAEDGSVIDRETVVHPNEVPPAALTAIRKAGGTIRQIVKDEVRAELKDGQIIKLDPPKYLYEADLSKATQTAEIQVSPTGQVIEPPYWRRKGTKEN
jgi:hypothetical protein